jgi:aryl-alcohol dehydrogenase-like predicted oxidoreductase
MAQSSTVTAAAAGTISFGGDLPANRFGFGAMRITGDGIWGEPKDRDEAIRVLKRALELGVTLIDTADSYGPEVSERLIAEALFPYPDELVIATKGGLLRPGAGSWTPDGRPTHLREACEGSLRRLRVDEIDVYQFHRPDPKVPFEESVGALLELKEEGKIRHIGLSNVTREQLQQAEKITPIVSVQNRYNLNDRASESVLEACEEENLAFIPWAPLQVGEMPKEVDHIAKKHRVSTNQVLLAWLLHHSPVMTPIPGTSKVAHLEDNVAAASLKLEQSDLEAIDQLTQ